VLSHLHPRRLAEVAKGNDVHIELKGTDMLMQRYVSLKALNLLKRKNELAGANGKLTMNIDKPITNEMDEMGMTLNKEQWTCLRSSLVAKWKVLP
jgi:hypothetical protein